MKREWGFTIVELLVVIVVIAILAAIAIVSYGFVRHDAEVSVTIDSINKIEKGFKLKFSREDFDVWPRDNAVFTDSSVPRNPAWGGNPDIRAAAKTAEFRDYISKLPETATLKDIVYDNDGDSLPPGFCSSESTLGQPSNWGGAILVFVEIGADIVKSVDEQLDDGNILCGKVRAGNYLKNTLIYQLSWDGSL